MDDLSDGRTMVGHGAFFLSYSRTASLEAAHRLLRTRDEGRIAGLTREECDFCDFWPMPALCIAPVNLLKAAA
jgi:hypothetical protein